MHPVGNIDLLASNLQMALHPDVRRRVTRSGKSLLLKNLTREWSEELERLILRTQTWPRSKRWILNKVGAGVDGAVQPGTDLVQVW
jgi:hypothetical protein